MPNSGWTYDESEFRVTVNITDNGTGALVATADYLDGSADFTNTYEAAPTEAQIEGIKNISGMWLDPHIPFEFTLFDETTDNAVQVIGSQNGKIIFDPITYDTAGTYTYRIEETQTSMSGWTLDSSIYHVVVTVIDDGVGSLVATVDYPDGTPSFENIYTAIDGPAIITGNKKTIGSVLEADQFEFGLYDWNDTLIQTTKNKADGSFTFDPISYTAEAVDTYYVKELTPSGDGWTIDGAIFHAVVTIVDDRQGNLVVTVDYPDGDITFMNTYTTDDTEITLNAIKLTKGAPLKASQFEFGIFDKITGELLITAFNDADGNVTFPPIKYSTIGNFNYVIKEIPPPGKS